MPPILAKERWKACFFTVNHLHLATFRRTTFYSATLPTPRLLHPFVALRLPLRLHETVIGAKITFT